MNNLNYPLRVRNNEFLLVSVFYGGKKVTWKIYFIVRAHAVANTCARISYYVHTQ